jgi:hypothetical protein
MKNLTRLTITAVASAVLAVTAGCASIDTATQKVGGVFGSKSDTTRSATGGAIIGCAGGAVLARILGNGSDMLKGCAAGAVVGGIASVQVHKHEVEKARQLALDVNTIHGVKATVATKQVEAKDEQTGKATQVEALDRLTIDLPAKGVKAHAADVTRVIDKASKLADEAAEPTTIEVGGPLPERDWIANRIRSQLKAGSTVKVVEVAHVTPRLVISPVPSVK